MLFDEPGHSGGQFYPRSKISRGFHELACQISGYEKSWKEKAAEAVKAMKKHSLGGEQ
jgi:hypothetical protein